MMNNLDVSGAVGECATGVEINGSADLIASDFAARSLGTSLQMKDQSTAKLIRANITGDASCTDSPLFLISSSSSFALDDSLLDGGKDGIDFRDAAVPTQAIFANVTIRNAAAHAMTGSTAMVHMTGGTLSSNGIGGLEATGGSWTFMDVTISQNVAFGFFCRMRAWRCMAARLLAMVQVFT